MRYFIILTVLCGIFLFSGSPLEAKVPISQESPEKQDALRKEHQMRVQRFDESKAEREMERELKKQRSALWKKEQAQITKEYRQLRSDRLAEINSEKEKEIAARARQKEIRAQLTIDETEYKSKLLERKMEILYGKNEGGEEADDETADTEESKDKPFWEKLLDLKK